MDLLWKKDASGLYTNLFKNLDPVLDMCTRIKIGIAVQLNKKNKETAAKLRTVGNERVAEKRWHFAMTMYNRSLRYAEIGTEDISLAYANRSLCFLKMKMYDKCLIDIELAIQAKYPQLLMAKLEERRTYCLKQMIKENPIKERSVPQLDFEADENFPGMANVLQMQYSKKYGRHFVAKCDIEIGKVVMVDEVFVNSIVQEPGCCICDTCFKTVKNFIACPKCTSALFCDQNCAEDILHMFRCGRSSKDDNNVVEFTIRSVAKAVCTLEGTDKLIDFVEGVVAGKPNKGSTVPHAIVEAKDKYRLFLKLNLWLSKAEQRSLIDFGSEVFKIVMNRLEDIFETENQKNFLMHLCVLHTYIVYCNAFYDKLTGGIFLLQNHFNHSCVPNTHFTFYENKSAVTTLRRIKKGEQLFLLYGQDFQFKSQEERQTKLHKEFGFYCDCKRCKNLNWPISSDVVRTDPTFQYLAKEANGFIASMEPETECEHLQQKCLAVLSKFSDFAWYTELDMVCHWFGQLSERIFF